MSFYRISSRLSRALFAQHRNSLIISTRQHQNQHQTFQTLCSQFHSFPESQNKVVAGQVFQLNSLALFTSASQQRFGFSSSASPESRETETVQSGNGMSAGNSSSASSKTNGDAKIPEQQEASSSENTKVADQKDESDEEEELSMEDLVKLVAEKEELLKVKNKEIEKMQDKVLRSYAEMENVMERTRRESENSKKFAIQNFAKSLLDVADNLGRASSVVKVSFSKIDGSKDTAGAVPLLKTLLEGVEMTEKQLSEVFKKFGVEKYDPTNEQFDPNRHNAVFQVPDASKPPGTVAIVLKAGYVLHDRVIRPAEVGVTDSPDTPETDGVGGSSSSS
ncbi:grpE protein homolog 2, mitochondrial-like [Diospyros lotus]|uniref:grpE protein homolog 2, mitochondrial-like n=1 Tax=Diospyros lotus TaxID=55363 RepID=UPI002254F347|nr:grpE protein homolog 2, mitochondrial-like [Diospyros lotus]